MKILMAGSSGLIGSAAMEQLTKEGHDVVPLVRTEAEAGHLSWYDIATPDGIQLLEGFDAVIHLGGENIGDRRWNPERKEALRTSRIDSTALLSNLIAQLKNKPSVFVCASAIGHYGDAGDTKLDENSPMGSGFLAELTRDWENATQPAKDAGVRVVNLRWGIVIAKQGGMLARLEQVFMAGIGGRLGKGTQWMSWVSIQDAVNIISFALSNPTIQGPVNACSPKPIRNADFTRIYAKVLRRPAFVPVFEWMLNLGFGKELSSEMMLASQRGKPAKLLAAGFTFSEPDMRDALESIYSEDADTEEAGSVETNSNKPKDPND